MVALFLFADCCVARVYCVDGFRFSPPPLANDRTRLSVTEGFRRGALPTGRPAAVKDPAAFFSGLALLFDVPFRHHDVQTQIDKEEADLAPPVLHGGKLAGHFPKIRFAGNGITPFVFMPLG